MGSKKSVEYQPVVAIPPGETIKENMEFLGMNQIELAARLDITTKHLCNILKGNAPITYDTALGLETVIGPKAEFWMSLEAGYQLNRTRIQRAQEIEEELKLLQHIPYGQMSDHGWVKPTPDKIERVLNCREFFAVSSLSSIKPSYSAMMRQHQSIKEVSDYAVLAWLRRAEILGMERQVDTFNKRNLKQLVPIFRALTLEEPESFLPKLEDACAQCGVALVLVESLKKSYVCGATIWRNNRAILALSARGKRLDSFWFTFFHELIHILEHTKKESHINFDRDDNEVQADRMASSYLISDNQYQYFITKYDYSNKAAIRNYAAEIGFAPCILVGRLLKDGLLEYKFYNDMRPMFTFPESSPPT